jgi:hypothetical protein
VFLFFSKPIEKGRKTGKIYIQQTTKLTNMVQTKMTAFTATAGEEIGLELGSTFISSYRTANPTDVMSYYVGRNILEQVLAQPGCVGIRFYNAYNEMNEKTLVYVGVSAQGSDMLNVTTVNVNGQLENTKGIVADRLIISKPKPSSTNDEPTWWESE